MKNKTFCISVLFVLTSSLLSFAQPSQDSKTVKTAELTLNPVIPEFQVNEAVGIQGASQSSPVISISNDGKVVIAWIDTRNGNTDIFIQRFATDGASLGSNTRINDVSTIMYEHLPVIATYGNGNFVIAWLDSLEGDDDIYAQRYSGDGLPLGNSFKVNDDEGTIGQNAPRIAVDKDGNFVVTWMDTRDGDEDIYAQRYSGDDTALGGNFKVNDESGGSFQSDPAVASDNFGNFVITWTDVTEGNPDIYAQCFSANGERSGGNFKVNTETGNSNQWNPAIVADDSGHFVIAWLSQQLNVNIFGQRLSSTGEKIGSSFRVNDEGKNVSQYDIAVAANDSGNMIITWINIDNGNPDIYAQRISGDGIKISSNFRVNTDQENAHQYTPAVSISNSGTFMIVWTDRRETRASEDFDIYAQYFANDGTMIDDNIRINDDPNYASQSEPDLTTDGNGNFLIAWIDQRNGIFDIYAQQYSADGTALTNNFMIDYYPGVEIHLSPAVSADNSGNFNITWMDNRRGDYNIYGCQYGSDLIALDRDFRINDDSGTAGQYYPDIATAGNGDFVVTWMDLRNGGSDIYAQRYSADGSKLAQNILVNDEPENAIQQDPTIAIDINGNFMITWVDHRDTNTTPNIFAQGYSSDGEALQGNFQVNENIEGAMKDHPVVAAYGNGNFIIAWRTAHNGMYDIYAQRYSGNINKVNNNFKVTDNQTGVYRSDPVISADDNGNFVIAWTNYENNLYNIFARCYSADGSAISGNFSITAASNSIKRYPSISLQNQRIYTTWLDNRSDVIGLDVWANVIDWNYIGINNTGTYTHPSLYILHQNYPNPFNPETRISYTLPVSGRVVLKIYDLLGREIRTLVNTFKEAGTHSCHINATGLASGVYFYKLQAGEHVVKTKKMVFLQ